MNVSSQVCNIKNVYSMCIACVIVYHIYIVCKSQTTKFRGARFDRLIPPLWSKAPQMDGGHKPLFLSVDIHSDFPSVYNFKRARLYTLALFKLFGDTKTPEY